MSKIFKRLTLLAALIVAVLCAGVFAAACDNGTNDVPTDPTKYNVTVVYPDGKAADGVSVQICVVLADGSTGSCFTPKAVDSNGKVVLNAPNYTLQNGEKFKLQVNNVPEGYKQDAYGSYYSTANYVTAPGNYTVTLEAD